MIKKLFCICFAIVLSAVASQGESTNLLHFTGTAFSIAPLDAPISASSQQVLMMFMPAEGGFSANINVMIQPYADKIEDYLELSMKQFKNLKFTLVNKKIAGKSAYIEYTGETQGHLLHWYSRAEKAGGKVYLITATATEDQWPTVSSKLKSCVDSFRCD